LSLKIDTRGAQQRNPFNALVCASTGVGKTRFIKNIVRGFYKQGYKILFFEPKSVEMINAKNFKKPPLTLS
jgi:DNA helicase HerA-like ATPase